MSDNPWKQDPEQKDELKLDPAGWTPACYRRAVLEERDEEVQTWANLFGHNLGGWQATDDGRCWRARCCGCGGYAELYRTGVVYYVFPEKVCPGRPDADHKQNQSSGLT